MDSNRFPLQNAIKNILDNPTTRPALPVIKDGSPIDDGSSVGDDNFREPAVYDTGTSPSVALNNENVIVEVHKNANSDALYYHVGKVADNKISFGGSQKYDSGVQPLVAINDGGLVIEVHKSENFDTLYYHIGRVDGDKITFGGSQKYDDGVQPSVAITNDGLVVEVHKSQSHDTLWYHIGKVDGNKITFGTSQEYGDGIYPSVAITNDGLVVEVHQAKDSDNFGTLHYHVGRVEGDKINWGGSFQYDSGSRPSVAITNDGVVVEVHQSEVFETVWYRGIGQVKDKTITWRNEKSQQYSKGREPRVTCNGELAVATHTDGEKLFSSVLTLPSFRSNWIELHGDNSYCYCACNSATNNKQRDASNHTMNIKAGAPYFYAVLTKDDDTIDFPTGAVLTIEGPDGTKYNRNIQEENQLVIMSGSSVRCLIVKDPKPGDWKMTMTVPEGVGFHCECNTVPSKDVYDTINSTLNKRAIPVLLLGFSALLILVGLNLITESGLMAAMYKGLKPDTASWIAKFMWSKSSKISPKLMDKYHTFVAKIAGVLNALADRLQNSGYEVVKKIPEFVEWFGKNFSQEEFVVVVQEHVPVDQVLFVYALVYFEVRYMTDPEEQNAVRHALWQCLLKKSFGENFAKKIGDAHEVARPGTPADNKADEINNIKGQQLADQVEEPYLCFDAAREMWKKGELQTRTDLEGDPT